MANSWASLPLPRQKLIRELQRINFGRIEGLLVENGQPVLDPRTRKQVEIKFGGENGPRPESATEDFLLKQQVVDLFAFFDRLGDGVVDVLEIKHGLPFRMIVTEVPA